MEGFHLFTFDNVMSALNEHLDPMDIIDNLVTNRTLSEIDKKELECKQTREDKVLYFMGRLLKKEGEAFENFLEALQSHKYYTDLVDEIREQEQNAKASYAKTVNELFGQSQQLETFHFQQMLWKFGTQVKKGVARHLLEHFRFDINDRGEIEKSEYPGLQFVKICRRNNIITENNVSDFLNKVSPAGIDDTLKLTLEKYSKERESPELYINFYNMTEEMLEGIRKIFEDTVSTFTRSRLLDQLFRDEYGVYLSDLKKNGVALRIPTASSLDKLNTDIACGDLAEKMQHFLGCPSAPIATFVQMGWDKENCPSVSSIFGPKPLCLPGNCIYDGSSVKCKDASQRGPLKCCKAGLDLLRFIGDDPVVVISISGLARSGKSYFLSQFFDDISFEASSSPDPTTIGIWIASSPDMRTKDGLQVRLILLDAEGVDTLFNHGAWDTKLFAVLYHLSSVIIYNSCDVPRLTDFQRLNFIARFSESILDAKSDTCSTNAFQKLAPSFVWLLRNVTLSLKGAGCSDWKEYIQKSFFHSQNVKNEDDSLIQIKKAMKTLFSSFDVIALPAPSTDPVVCENLNKTDERHIDHFLKKVRDAKVKIISQAPQKVIAGNFATGNSLANFLETFISAINVRGDNISSTNSWDADRFLGIQSILTKCNITLTAKLQEINLPCDTKSLAERFENALKETKTICCKESKFMTKDEDFKSQMQTMATDKYKKIQVINCLKSKQFCRERAKCLQKEHANFLALSGKTFENVKEVILKQFAQETKGLPNAETEKCKMIDDLKYLWDGYELSRTMKKMCEEIESGVKEILANSSNSEDFDYQYSNAVKGAKATLKQKSAKRHQKEQDNLQNTFSSHCDKTLQMQSSDFCKNIIRQMISTLERQVTHPDTTEQILDLDALFQQYRDKGRGPAVALVGNEYKEEIRKLIERAVESQDRQKMEKSRVHCINIMHEMINVLERQVKHPNTKERVSDLDTSLQQYRHRAVGPAVVHVENQYTEQLRNLIEKAVESQNKQAMADSRVLCTTIMNEKVRALQRQVRHPNTKEKILNLHTLLEQYRAAAEGPAVTFVENEYKEQLGNLREEAVESQKKLRLQENIVQGVAIVAGSGVLVTAGVAAGVAAAPLVASGAAAVGSAVGSAATAAGSAASTGVGSAATAIGSAVGSAVGSTASAVGTAAGTALASAVDTAAAAVAGKVGVVGAAAGTALLKAAKLK